MVALRVLILISVFLLSQGFTSTGIVTSNVKLRNLPTLESQVKGSISEGAGIEVLELQGDFYRVKVNGQEGYVASKYIRVEPETEKPETTFMDTVIGWLTIIYGIFSFIVGQMMVGPFMRRFFSGLSFYSSSRDLFGHVFLFLEVIAKKIVWEIFIGLVAIIAGGMLGWAYIIYRVMGSKKEVAVGRI